MEFERIGSRRLKVQVGDVFAALPNDGRGFVHGQVLRDDVNLAGAVVLLVVFFEGRSDQPGLSCSDLGRANVMCWPFVTNKTAWLDGRFTTLGNCPPVDVGRIGLRSMTNGAVFDLSGVKSDEGNFDVLGRFALSPYGAIAMTLADHLA
jgi:Immunity protein 26